MKKLPGIAAFLLTFGLSAHSVDLIIFSYNRPMQLYAVLESLKSHVTGLNEIFVIYRASNTAYAEAYSACFNDFEDMGIITMQQGSNPHAEFKSMVIKALQATDTSHIMFSTDDAVVTADFDVCECARLMDKFGAHVFLPRMGKNIVECYSRKMHVGNPPLAECEPGVHTWRFDQGKGDWCYPHSVDMGIFRKTTTVSALQRLGFAQPNELEGNWASRAPLSKLGMCYETSRMMTIPLNLVNPSDNPHMNAYSVEELLARFQLGEKIDIDAWAQFENRAPHADAPPTFIARGAVVGDD